MSLIHFQWRARGDSRRHPWKAFAVFPTREGLSNSKRVYEFEEVHGWCRWKPLMPALREYLTGNVMDYGVIMDTDKWEYLFRIVLGGEPRK
jgi:hypothetical protein